MSSYLLMHINNIVGNFGKVVENGKSGEGTMQHYGDGTTEALLLFIKPKVEEVYGKELFPTYSFWRKYFKDTECPAHKDRPSCEVSLTMCLGGSNGKAEWPINVEGEAFSLEPGEAVIYKGCDQEHWRDKLNYDWHVQVFLHFIEVGGKYDPEYRFDRRPYLYSQPMAEPK